jgi:hypothetical protein
VRLDDLVFLLAMASSAGGEGGRNEAYQSRYRSARQKSVRHSALPLMLLTKAVQL